MYTEEVDARGRMQISEGEEEGGVPIYILQNFPQKLHKMEEFRGDAFLALPWIHYCIHMNFEINVNWNKKKWIDR